MYHRVQEPRATGHLITRREEVMRKGGEEARSVRVMCDECAAHGDRAAVGVESRMPRVCIGKKSWLVCAGTAKRRVVFLGFPDEPKENKTYFF